MGKYLDIVRQASESSAGCEKSAESEISHSSITYLREKGVAACEKRGVTTSAASRDGGFSRIGRGAFLAPNPLRKDLFRLSRLFRTFAKLEARCPAWIAPDDWQQAVEDSRRFLVSWGEQAEALGWTAADVFGLAPVPEKPRPSYSRLSRYDATGLVWLLRGRPVVAITADTAAIQHPSGNKTVYRRCNKPGLGPVGDSLDDFR